MRSKPRGKIENPRIVSADALYGDYFDLTLSNGNAILLGLGKRIREPAFAALIENGMFDKPKTDGERLYWPGGPSLTFNEIIKMVVE